MAIQVRELYEPDPSETYPYIGLEHIEQQSLKLCGIGRSSDTQSTKKKFQKEDILFGSLRPYFRKVAKPKFDGVCSTDITVVRAKNGTDQTFLYYFIANEPFINHATNISSGIRMPRANWDVLTRSEWLFPSFQTQRKIASILSAYDDLIENNTRRIKILEEMVQAIYREWFVEFKAPGVELRPATAEEQKLTGKDVFPKGWEVVEVKRLVKRVPSGKKYENKTVQPEGEVPVLDQGKSGIIGYHDEEPGVIASEEKPVIIFANHTCYQRLIQLPFSAIQNVLPFIPNPEKHRNIYWLHWATKDLVKFNDYKGHWPEFMSKRTVCPSSELAEVFGDFAMPIVRSLFKLEKKNTNLRRTRDLLPPKLMSGEVEVDGLDLRVGERNQ